MKEHKDSLNNWIVGTLSVTVVLTLLSIGQANLASSESITPRLNMCNAYYPHSDLDAVACEGRAWEGQASASRNSLLLGAGAVISGIAFLSFVGKRFSVINEKVVK